MNRMTAASALGRLGISLTFALLTSLSASSQPWTFPLTGGGSYEMLGEQFVNPSETVVAYSAFIAGGPTDGDNVFIWNVAMQNFDPIQPTYNGLTHTWSHPATLLTRGQAFFYISDGLDTTVTRNTSGAPAMLLPSGVGCPPAGPPGLAPLLPDCPNTVYALSSQEPKIANYADLIGASSPLPHPQTFVWTWNVAAFNIDLPSRYSSLKGWQPAPPAVALGKGAFVAWIPPDAPPQIQTAQLSAAYCPTAPSTLNVTFASPGVDWQSAAYAASYAIYDAPTGGNIVGSVSSVVLGPVSFNPGPGFPPNLVPGGWLPVVTTVTLNVTLLSGSAYWLGAPGVTSVGGVSVGNRIQISFPSCNVPPNDAPGAAIPLTIGTTYAGSLTCATPTSKPPYGPVFLFPTGSDETARDMWYSFSPQTSGNVTIETCEPSPCASDTFLSVFQGYPDALDPIPGTWFGPPGSGGCPHGAQVQFPAMACAIYYIRVSAPSTGSLPGQFALKLTETPAVPANDLCGAAIQVRPSSSTNFDNITATTTPGLDPSVHIVYDVWFKFRAPPGGGIATVETCTADFNTAVAIYPGCASLGSPPLAYNEGGCGGNGSTVSFPTTTGNFYYICVGGLSTAPPAQQKGCGFLHISYPPPPVPTPPPNGHKCRLFTIHGLPNGTGWSWSLSSGGQCAFNIQDLLVTGVPAGGTATDLANKFITSIGSSASFVSSAGPAVATFQICLSPTCAPDAVLKVGPFGSPPTCWVDFASLNLAVNPCTFNPEIYEVPTDQETDCNTNNQSDYLDILLGVSSDVNGNGIPDECEGCIGPVIAAGPASVSVHLGANATFAVQAAGSSPFSYQWRAGGVPISGQTNATLVLTNLTLDLAGLYDVIVTNACGQTTSAQAVLFVDPAPWLNAGRQGPNVVLWWGLPGYQLQSSPAVDDTASWTNIPGPSPVTLPADGLARYFRLRQSGQ